MGVKEFQPSFKSISQKTPYHPKNFKITYLKKIYYIIMNNKIK